MSNSWGRRAFLKTMSAATGACAIGMPAAGYAGNYTPVQPVDAFRRVPLHDIKLGGYVGGRIDSCIENRIKAQDVRELILPFETRPDTWCWTSEFWGKWFTSAASAFAYTQDPELRRLLDAAVRGLLATQTPDGYIGAYNEQNRLSHWDVWGRKYSLLGLLDYYDLTGDAATLEGAVRLADHLMTEVGPGKADIVRIGLYRGMPSSSILEPIVRLYRLTNQSRYLDFARYIVAQWTTPGAPDLIGKALAEVPVGERFPQPEAWWTWENGQKAYEMMSCYEGLLELYRETGAPEYREAVIRAFENIRDTEITIAGAGASLECWYSGKVRQTEPALHMMETCVTMTWMKFCENLLRLTGDPAFADEIERSAYNALLGAMTPDGSTFSKYSPLSGVRELGENQCDTTLNCCIANGPRAMMLLPQAAVMTDEAGPVVNLYIEGTAQVPLPSGNSMALQQQTNYPESGDVAIRLHMDRAERFPLRLRVPAWSARTEIVVNGQAVASPEPGRYAVLEREWAPDDLVQMRLDVRGRLVRSPGARHVHLAVLRGPVVLARDARLGQESIGAPVPHVPEGEDALKLERMTEGAPEGAWMAFRATLDGGPAAEEQARLSLMDYSSAGNTWSDASRFRVWMPRLLDPSKEQA